MGRTEIMRHWCNVCGDRQVEVLTEYKWNGAHAGKWSIVDKEDP